MFWYYKDGIGDACSNADIESCLLIGLLAGTYWILLRMFWLNHSFVLRQFLGKLIIVSIFIQLTFYKGLQMILFFSCEGGMGMGTDEICLALQAFFCILYFLYSYLCIFFWWNMSRPGRQFVCWCDILGPAGVTLTCSYHTREDIVM